MGFRRREFAVCLIHLVIFACQRLEARAFVVNGGLYRIRSMYDGLFASAGARVGDDLGGLTTEKWGNFREQRWDLIGLDQIGRDYWISAQENTFNKMSAAVVDGKMDRHISQLVPVKMDTYLIRSSLTGRCLDNPGYGLPILSLPCDDISVRQHWEMELLSKQ